MSELGDRLVDEAEEEYARWRECRNYYFDHCRRMEEARINFLRDSIAQGDLELSRGEVAWQLYERPKDLKWVPTNKKHFSEELLQMAMKSLDEKETPLDYWIE